MIIFNIEKIDVMLIYDVKEYNWRNNSLCVDFFNHIIRIHFQKFI